MAPHCHRFDLGADVDSETLPHAPCMWAGLVVQIGTISKASLDSSKSLKRKRPSLWWHMLAVCVPVCVGPHCLQVLCESSS